MWNSVENMFARLGSFWERGDDEEVLRWTVLERLPTYARVWHDIFRNVVGDTMETDVGELEAKDQKLLLDGLLAISFQPTEVRRNRKVRGSSFVGGGWKESFCVINGGDVVKSGKPSPEMCDAKLVV